MKMSTSAQAQQQSAAFRVISTALTKDVHCLYDFVF
jgi:hypothetical protein